MSWENINQIFDTSAVCQGYDMNTEKIEGKEHRNNNMKNWRGQRHRQFEDNNDTDNPTWSK